MTDAVNSASDMPRLVGAIDDLVVHVRVIGDERDVVAELLEEPPPRVKDDDRAQIPDVRVVVDRRPADVKRDFAGDEGDEFLDLIPKRGIKHDVLHKTILQNLA